MQTSALMVRACAHHTFREIDLKVRPVFHRSAERVRAHVLLCMLAYYVEWHMRQRLSPMLFDSAKFNGLTRAYRRSSV